MKEVNRAEMTLIEKLSKIRKIAEVAQKDSDGYGYRYTSITQILAKVSAGMDKYGVMLIPSIRNDTCSTELHQYVENKFDRSGNMYEKTSHETEFCCCIDYTWVNVDDPTDTLKIPWFITGAQSDPSQAMGSALTYGLRYMLTQMFQIAQPEDDPDNWRSKQQEAADEEDREIAVAITNEIDKVVQSYIESNPDDRDNLIKIIKKNCKVKGKASADYTKVTNPEMAKNIFDAVNNYVSKATSKGDK